MVLTNTLSYVIYVLPCLTSYYTTLAVTGSTKSLRPACKTFTFNVGLSLSLPMPKIVLPAFAKSTIFLLASSADRLSNSVRQEAALLKPIAIEEWKAFFLSSKEFAKASEVWQVITASRWPFSLLISCISSAFLISLRAFDEVSHCWRFAHCLTVAGFSPWSFAVSVRQPVARYVALTCFLSTVRGEGMCKT